MLNVLLFVTTYLAGFIFAIIANPAYAFALYEAVYFFYPQDKWWGTALPDISYSYFTVLLMMGVLLLNRELFLNPVFKIPPLRWLYFLLFLYAIAYFYAVRQEIHYDALNTYLKLVVIITIAFKLIDSRERLNIAIWGYIFGAWYMGFSVWQVGRTSGNRVEGIGTVDSPDANGLAAAIAPAVVLAIYYFWRTQNKYYKILFAIAGAFITNALVLINSRGAFLGTAASIVFLFYYLYFSKLQKKNQKRTVIFLLIAGLMSAAYLVDEAFIERMTTIKEEKTLTAEVETGSTRVFFWMAAWDMAKDHPFGGGFRAFNVYAPFYIPQHVNTGGSLNRTVHSTWFEALTEIGYLGLFGLIMMVFSSYKILSNCKKKLKEDGDSDHYYQVIAIQAALICFVISMTFLNRLRAEILHWLILYAACAYNIYILKAQNLINESKIKNAEKLS